MCCYLLLISCVKFYLFALVNLKLFYLKSLKLLDYFLIKLIFFWSRALFFFFDMKTDVYNFFNKMPLKVVYCNKKLLKSRFLFYHIHQYIHLM